MCIQQIYRIIIGGKTLLLCQSLNSRKQVESPNYLSLQPFSKGIYKILKDFVG